MAGGGPVSFTGIAEGLFLTPWDEATLTLPEIDAVAAWGLESSLRAYPGTAQTKAESHKAVKEIIRADFTLLCSIFNNTLPDLVPEISCCSPVRWNCPADGTS